MIDDPSASDGRRIRAIRKRADLNQKELAARVGKTQSWVSQVEHDIIPVDSISLLNELAKALRVHPNEIVGKPYRGDNPNSDAGHQAIPEIRRQVERYDLPPAWDGPISPLPVLQGKVSALAHLGLQARYTAAAQQAPPLLAELQAATYIHTGTQREQACQLLADAYREVYALVQALGYGDLAGLVTRNVRWFAGQSGDPLMVAAGGFLRTRDLWSSASWGDALLVTDRTLADIGDLNTPDALEVQTFGHLAAAVTAARAANEAEAWERHTRAVETIKLLPPERPAVDRYRFSSNGANVAIHGVAVAVELRNGQKAIELGADLHLPDDMPPYRVGHHYMDMARGWLWYGDREKALRSMEQAYRAAPMMIRHHPMARRCVRQLREAPGRTYQERLRRLCVRMQVL